MRTWLPAASSLKPGMGYQVADSREAHPCYTTTGAAMFIVAPGGIRWASRIIWRIKVAATGLPPIAKCSRREPRGFLDPQEASSRLLSGQR